MTLQRESSHGSDGDPNPGFLSFPFVAKILFFKSPFSQAYEAVKIEVDFSSKCEKAVISHGLLSGIRTIVTIHVSQVADNQTNYRISH